MVVIQLNYKRSSQWIEIAISSKRSERFRSIPVAIAIPMSHAKLNFPAMPEELSQKLHTRKVLKKEEKKAVPVTEFMRM